MIPALVIMLLLQASPATQKADLPTIVSAHIVLDPVQAKEQGRPIPVCTEQSTTTCYDPTLRHISASMYSKKEHCESGEGTNCTSLYVGGELMWFPIGKTVFTDETDPPATPDFTVTPCDITSLAGDCGYLFEDGRIETWGDPVAIPLAKSMADEGWRCEQVDPIHIQCTAPKKSK